LIDKARKQKMAFIFANQRETQITSLAVRDALSRSAIQARGEAQHDRQPPVWHVAIDRRQAARVSVPHANFASMPRMTSDEYEEMMRAMHDRYYAHKPQMEFEPATSSQPSSTSGPVIDGEYKDITGHSDGDTDPKPWRNA
jgi:hypothetical protein